MSRLQNHHARLGRSLYFAFGSNLSIEQMAARCPSAVAVAPSLVEGYRIGFTGDSSSWGGGVATVVGDPDAFVPGLLWSLTDWDLRRLDRYEGHPWHYQRERVVAVVPRTGAHVLAWTYVLDGAPSRPSDRYLRVIAEGYRMLGFGEPFTTMLADAADVDVRPTVIAWDDEGLFDPWEFCGRVGRALVDAGRPDLADSWGDIFDLLDGGEMESIDDVAEAASRFVEVVL